MKKRFELVAGTSKKFWEIETVARRMTVRFGRIGTAGQEKSKRFSTALLAERAAATLIAEKTGKGYRPAGAAARALDAPPPKRAGKELRHPIDGFRLPPLVLRLLRLPEPLVFLDVSWVLRQGLVRGNDLAKIASRIGELMYPSHPFELSELSVNGGDGLEYAWVVHAPELDVADPPMVSWAPVDDGGAAYLGTTTDEAVENLLIAEHHGWRKFGRDRDDELGPLSERRSWRDAVKALGREPNVRARHVNYGGRIARSLVPGVPKGWRFEPGPDGIGVLARAELFGLKSFAPFAKSSTFSAAWDEAERLAKEGMHAGALVLWKRLRRWNGDDPDTVRGMRDAYAGLGRAMHVRRAELWLENHG